MAIRKSSNSGIPFGGTSGRPANPANGQPYFNGDIGRLELYTSATGWQNIVQETPGVASITGHYYESDNSGTFVISGTNFVSGAIAYAVGTNGTEYQATTTTYNSLVQLTAVFDNLSGSYEPYDIKVTNPSNLFGLLPDAFYINESPVWSTTAGSLGTFVNGSVSIQLASTDDESDSRTYTLSSGSLPTGLSLSSSGLISGTMAANPGATYSFTITVSDGYNLSVSRSFSISVTPATVTGGTLTSDATYYYRTFTSSSDLVVSNNTLPAGVLCIAGGGAGGWNNAGGGGAGGFIETLNYTIPIGTHAISIGSGGAGHANGSAVTPAPSGTNTTIGSLFTAIGGGGGNSWTSYASGSSGGSGGGSSGNPTGIYNGGSSTQSSQSGISGSSGYGYAGGAGGSAQGGSDVGGGGGGGAGGVGQPCRGFGYADYIGSGAPGGHGGLGRTSVITGTLLGGGGGGGAGGNGTSGSYWSGEVNGGTGGGGPSATWSTSNSREVGLAGAGNGGAAARSKSGGHATANTGSGGGGGDNTDGGNGGSGIVVVRYLKAAVGG